MSVGAQPARGWSVDGWLGFWSNPSAEVALKRVPTIVTPDVVAVWPRVPGQVRGPSEYAQRVVDLLTLVPDLRLELGEHAVNGEFVFVRWAARGTGPDGRFEGIGTDRFRLQDGLVAESLIMSDLAIFGTLAQFVERPTARRRLGDLASAAAENAGRPLAAGTIGQILTTSVTAPRFGRVVGGGLAAPGGEVLPTWSPRAGRG